MIACRICPTWTGLCQVRSENRLNKHLRVTGLRLMTSSSKFSFCAVIWHKDFWIKKISSVGNSRFPRKIRSPVHEMYKYNEDNFACGYRMCAVALDCNYLEEI
jgi:hypothetical protein